jgi:hypothetical protein
MNGVGMEVDPVNNIKKWGLFSNRGASAVEFALIMPIFFLLLFGIVDFGWYFFNQHTIQYATREGTRLALVGATLKDEHGNEMTREESIIRTIKHSAAIAVNPDDLRISIYPVGSGYSDPEEWETTINAGSGGDYMRVRVLYTYNFLTPMIGNFLPSGLMEMRAAALYRNENF